MMFEVKVRMKILLSSHRPKRPIVVGDDRARGFHSSAHRLDYLQLVVVCVSQLKFLFANRRWRVLSLLTVVCTESL